MLVQAISAQPPLSADPGVRADAPLDPNRPLAQELAASASPNLVLAVAGSLIISAPAGSAPVGSAPAGSLTPWDPGVVALLDGSAFPQTQTRAIADIETSLFDEAGFVGFPYPWADSPLLHAAPVIASELKMRGLAILARANRHALDWGIEGMSATGLALDAAGIAHAGTGNDQGLSRRAAYFDDPHGAGRIALVAAATTYRPTTNALPANGAAPARPGVSGMELTPARLVSPQQRDTLERAACRFQYLNDPAPCAKLAPSPTVSVFGSTFRSASSVKDRYITTYELNRRDAEDTLRSVRDAKQNSDLAVLAVHADQLGSAAAAAPTVPQFLVEFAHAAVDAGADLVMTTGRSALGPIEIYESPGRLPRPILYGMGNLYWSPGFAPAPDSFESIIVRSRIEGSTLTVEIYPLDLHAAGGADGMPRLADAPTAQTILLHLQSLSAPYGTTISVEPFGSTRRGVIIRTARPAMKDRT